MTIRNLFRKFVFLPINTFGCHSREDGNPVVKRSNWMPVCTGMTTIKYLASFERNSKQQLPPSIFENTEYVAGRSTARGNIE